MTWIPLKYVAKISAGQSPPSELVTELSTGTPFLQGNAEFGPESPHARYQCEAPPKRAEAGDILISVRAPVGALNIADREYGIGRGLCAIRAVNCDQRYLWWWLHYQHENLDAVATGSTYPAVSADDLAQLRFPYLSASQQRLAASYLDTETRRIVALVDAADHQVALLAERRRALITAAVTGKIDVSTASGRGVLDGLS